MVEIIDEQDQLTIQQIELIQSLVEFTTKHLEVERSSVAINIVSAEEIQQLNAQYRNIDEATDVLSFPNEATDELLSEFAKLMDETEIETMSNYLGDIIISYPHIQAQADEYNHSFNRELGFLVVHGFLHLNGYDHETKAEEAQMYTLQEKVLTEYGLERK